MKAFAIPYTASRMFFSCATATILILMVVRPPATYSEGPTFEVASIKPVPPPNLTGPLAQPVGCAGGPGTKDPGRWTCENTNLANLVRIAFDLKVYQLEGWYSPLYQQNKHFSVRAKVPEGATREQFRQMKQNLLIERFGLKFHLEKKETQGYELVRAKDGPKFKESDLESQQDDASGLPSVPLRPSIGKDGFPTMPPGRSGVSITANAARGQWSRTTMEDFAAALFASFMAGKPVIDGTELSGKYDLSLNWAPELLVSPIAPSSPAENSLPMVPQASGPNFFTALQDQLGLKLVPKKVTIEIFVVDHIEKMPTEN
jgi:uncharacterized protein (TIGR03435 family)